MQVTYNQHLKIAGIGLVPWSRLGLEQWLPDYAIASLFGWDLERNPALPPVYSLGDYGKIPELDRYNTQNLLRTAEFCELLNEKLPGYDLLTYKPVSSIPAALADRKFLMSNPNFTRSYENKVWFRKKFGNELPAPAYTIYDRKDLGNSREDFEKLLAGRPGIVLQDEQLSGGKGTFFIQTYQDYLKALQALNELSSHRQIVVSDAVKSARERSIQACVTKYGIFTGPLQRQIVADPLLANVAVAEGDKFCGAVVARADQGSKHHVIATNAARKIGEALQADGYQGIFGVDFLLEKDQKLHTLEVNARITGVTPLLTALYQENQGIPFYLLHILELGNYDYEITQMDKIKFDNEGSLLVLHSLENQSVIIQSTLASGTYKYKDQALHMVSRNIHLRNLSEDEFIVQEYMPTKIPIRPGGRLLTLQFPKSVIDLNTDRLYNDIIKIISAVRQQTVTQAAF